MQRLRTITAGTLLLAAVACGSDSPTEPVSVVGTYNLQLVNGQPVPFTLAVFGPNDRIEVTGATLVFAANGSYSLDFFFREIDQGVVVDEFTDASVGTYTVTGSTVRFTDTTNNSTFSGTASGDQLIIAEGGFALVFVR